MTKNQFKVDLGDLNLTDAHRQRINSAIQKAVAGELATIGGSLKRYVLIPVDQIPKWPILYGIIVRPLIPKLSFDSIKFEQ